MNSTKKSNRIWILIGLVAVIGIGSSVGIRMYAEHLRWLNEDFEGNMYFNIYADNRTIAGDFTDTEKQIIATGAKPDELKQNAYLTRAWAYANLKRYDDMYADINAAYALPVNGRNKRVGHLAETALILWEHGKREEAMKLWDKTFEDNPLNARSRELIASRLAADPRPEMRDEKVALRYAQEAHELEPNDRASVTTLAIALAANGKFDEAIARDEEALAIKWKPREMEIKHPPFYADEKIRARLELYKRKEPYRLKIVKM